MAVSYSLRGNNHRGSQNEPFLYPESDESTYHTITGSKPPSFLVKGGPLFRLKQDKSNSLPNVSKQMLRSKLLEQKHLQEFQKPIANIAEDTPTEQELLMSTIGQDYRNIRNIILNLQKISHKIADKYDVEPELSLVPISARNTPDLRSNSLGEGSTHVFLENERLLGKQAAAGADIKWSDANSAVTSPGSTGPDSPFAGSRNRNRKKNHKYPERAVLKTGECNVLQKNHLGHSRLRYMQDIFTTLVDIKWRWTLLIFSLSFIGSWLFYAGLYWLIAYAHGDFIHIGDDDWKPCVDNMFGFTTAFLFSVETQHTIGYGGRATSEECPEAIFIMCMQSITGVMISAFMAGIFFAKMARPKQRRQTLLFSRRAVICQRDGQLCLMFRVGDMRKSHIIGTSIRAQIFRTRTTREGEELRQYQGELSVTADGCEDGLLFIWPLTVVHIIDKDSPLYNISAQELLHEKLEIVAVLEGTVESTGQTTQARSSYIPSEIKWGHRFQSIVGYNEDRQGYEIDYKKFNDTIKVATPLCSARDLEELYFIHSELVDYNQTITPDSA